MCRNVTECSVVILLIASTVSANPLSLLQTEHSPLAAELSSRVVSHTPRLTDGKADPRLPLPSAQELEAIQKVAQLLVMLGGQVIPGIIGEPPTSSTQAPADVPYDPVSTN